MVRPVVPGVVSSSARIFASPTRPTRSRIAASLLLSAALAAAAGCGNASVSSDREVDDYINKALPELNGTPDQVADAQNLLEKAAAITTASAPEQIRAKVLQGQAELQAAEALQPTIDADSVQIHRLAWDIQSLAAQLQAHNQVADALAQNDPADLQTKLKQDVAAVQGGPDNPDWVKIGDNSIHTLASTNDTIASLQSQAKDLQSKVDTLTDQRNKVQQEGDNLAQQSDLAHGDKAVDLFKQAVSDRQKSDDLSLQIDQLNNTLSRVKADLAVRQGQQKVLNQAIEAYGAASTAADKNWSDAQKQIDAQRDAAKGVLGDESEAVDLTKDPTGGLTIAAKSATLAKLAQENATNRNNALPHVNNAIQFFQDAEKLAGQVKNDLAQRRAALPPSASQRPEVDAWNATQKTLDASRFQLLQARAQVDRANLFAGQANEAQLRLKLITEITPLLQTAKLTAPAALQDADNRIAAAAKDGQQQAEDAYKTADSLLDGIIEGAAPDDVKKSATAARIFADYSWYLWATSQNDKSADDHLKTATAMRDEILGSGGTVRNLPAQLVVAAGAPTPNGPTTAPAAQ